MTEDKMANIGSSSKKVNTLNKKKNGSDGDKSLFSQVISMALGLIATVVVIAIIFVEAKGRSMKVSPKEWQELIKEHPYEYKETYVRSPCPMLNTLANHGFIARDGHNIKPMELFKVLTMMGAPPLVTVQILAFVYSSLKEASPTEPFLSQLGFMPSLDLNRLTIAGVLEHDVSLTRNDLSQEPHDTQRPIPKYVHRMIRLAQVANNNTEFDGFFTRKNENDARRLRWLESTTFNPYMHLSLFYQFASSTECSLLLDILGRDGQMKLPHLESFLIHEKFPQDWHPRETTYSVMELATKPIICWTGLHKSKVDLDYLKELQ